MICFKDRTFCGSEACVNACGRKMTDELLIEYKKWSKKNFGTEDGGPISYGLFCGGSFSENP